VEESFGVYTITIEKMASLQQWVRRIKKNRDQKKGGVFKLPL